MLVAIPGETAYSLYGAAAARIDCGRDE